MKLFFTLAFVFLYLNSMLLASEPTVSEESRKKLFSLYDKGAADPVIKNWIDKRLKDVIKDPLDAEIDRLLENSTVAKELRTGVLSQLSHSIAEAYRVHLGNAAQALPGKDGQYQFLYELVQDSAGLLNFTAESRAKMKVFVVADPNMNAYTYSSGDEIHVVVYSGLLDAMARNEYQKDDITYYKDIGELKQVVAHELFHVKGSHIENQSMIFAIFFAVGENLIPIEGQTEVDKEKEKSKDSTHIAALRNAQLDTVLTTMAQSFFPHHQGELQNKVMSKALPGIKENIRKNAQLLRSRVGNKALERMAVKLFQAVRGLESAEDAAFDIKAFKQLQDDLKRLSRSQEASCDNAGYIVNGDHKSSVLTYARLAGGKGVKYEAIERQIRNLHNLLNGEQSGDRFAPAGSTHPEAIFRAAQFDMFRHTDAYKVFSNPFRRALYDYFSLSSTLVELEQKVRSREIMEVSMRGSLNLNRESLIAMASALSKWILDELMTELKSAEAATDKDKFLFPLFYEFTEVMNRILYYDNDKGEVFTVKNLRAEMGKPNRLVHDLLKQIETNLTNEHFKERLVELLSDLVPPPSIFPLEMLGLQSVLRACKGEAKKSEDSANGG